CRDFYDIEAIISIDVRSSQAYSRANHGESLSMPSRAPFADFLGRAAPTDPLRRKIDLAHRLPEPECVPPLIEAATLPIDATAAIRALTIRTVSAMRAQKRKGGVESLIQEYALSSQEGVALMCLAEALLRTPDNATR